MKNCGIQKRNCVSKATFPDASSIPPAKNLLPARWLPTRVRFIRFLNFLAPIGTMRSLQRWICLARKRKQLHDPNALSNP